MTVSLAKSDDEIKQLPLVELTYELLKAKKEPIYFREIMEEIRKLRGMTENEAMEVIARLYTEINIDGRFIHLGQNVWGLKRWYPIEKANERPQSSKRFVRSTGDAFSDDDELLDDYDEESSEEDLDDSDDAEAVDFDSRESEDDDFDDSDDADEVDDAEEDFDGEDEEDIEEEFADETEDEDDELDDANPDDDDE
ncbi:DNA-directed RNA polymerase subunit delta [Alicyclobacillus mengziensis]|uniref:Probable DNA-directed RNA polymerase subunit delta n=1 Tax=Alicyclobacillus mengziensis TaxID=2931921 RepID=A0A9X7VYY3_9BACL|nr:DNA-directed RNA polymerase subunit delta [Alicyclobacillus mengziensis]QSO47619.1 DNA-directed RNA polymerase subunit delta [Alicyclobacillus mengziensis]